MKLLKTNNINHVKYFNNVLRLICQAICGKKWKKSFARKLIKFNAHV